MLRGAAAGLLGVLLAWTAADAQADSASDVKLLVPARVFDGTSAQLHDGWAVLVRRGRIDAVGPLAAMTIPAGTPTIRLAGLTLLPGLIDAHSHLLLHPYNEAT
jgi:imidazolonepropionase-like amidohydrolase